MLRSVSPSKRVVRLGGDGVGLGLQLVDRGLRGTVLGGGLHRGDGGSFASATLAR
jgi:hypothetical protein